MKKILPVTATLFALLAPVVSAQSRYVTSTATNSGDALFGLGMVSAYFGFYAACFCVVIGIQVAIAVWVYRDAQKRMPDNAVLWLLVSLVGGFIGLIVYLIVRSDKPVIQKQNTPVSLNN